MCTVNAHYSHIRSTLPFNLIPSFRPRFCRNNTLNNRNNPGNYYSAIKGSITFISPLDPCQSVPVEPRIKSHLVKHAVS